MEKVQENDDLLWSVSKYRLQIPGDLSGMSIHETMISFSHKTSFLNIELLRRFPKRPILCDALRLSLGNLNLVFYLTLGKRPSQRPSLSVAWMSTVLEDYSREFISFGAVVALLKIGCDQSLPADGLTNRHHVRETSHVVLLEVYACTTVAWVAYTNRSFI